MSKRQFSGRWFRVYDEAVDEPKLVMLSDKLHRFLFSCWCLASKHDGYLPAVSEMACRLRKSTTAVCAMLAELHEKGLLDREGETFTPHNWCCRQYQSDSSTQRVRKFRDRHGNGNETFRETPHETKVAVAETAPEQKQIQNRTDTEAEGRRAAISEQEWPRATDAIQGRFPSTDGVFILRLVQDTIQSAISAGIDPALVTDEAIAAAIAKSLETDNVQRAGLLLRTVPTIIRNWGKR